MTYEASAPGRLDVLGGVADYSGSAVLQLPIKERTYVSLTWRDDAQITVQSARADAETAAKVAVAVTDLPHLREAGLPPWSLYVLGCVAVGVAEGLFVARGMRLQVHSDVPVGAGLSSSAALTVAVWRVLAKAYSLDLEPQRLAHLAQSVENEIVGAPCGIMDQLAVHCGKPGVLLPIMCRPDLVGPMLPIPANWRLWAVDSGVRHEVSGEAYATARAASFMGVQILRRRHGFLGSYLTEMGATGPRHEEKRARQSVLERLPKMTTGRDFLRTFGGLEDALSLVVPDRVYPVRAATEHPIFEHERIVWMIAALDQLRQLDGDPAYVDAERSAIEQCGGAMFLAHGGYSAIGLGHAATDAIVNRVYEVGARAGLYGARVTGGGSGGSVVVLGDEGSDGLDLAETIEVPAQRVLQVYP